MIVSVYSDGIDSPAIIHDEQVNCILKEAQCLYYLWTTINHDVLALMDFVRNNPNDPTAKKVVQTYQALNDSANPTKSFEEFTNLYYTPCVDVNEVSCCAEHLHGDVYDYAPLSISTVKIRTVVKENFYTFLHPNVACENLVLSNRKGLADVIRVIATLEKDLKADPAYKPTKKCLKVRENENLDKFL